MKNASLIAFEVTRQCRFNCVYCRAGAAAGKPDELTTEQCKKILDSIAAFERCIIIFTGGEPSIPPELEQLMAHGGRHGVSLYGISTNGSGLTDPQRVREHGRSG